MACGERLVDPVPSFLSHLLNISPSHSPWLWRARGRRATAARLRASPPRPWSLLPSYVTSHHHQQPRRIKCGEAGRSRAPIFSRDAAAPPTCRLYGGSPGRIWPQRPSKWQGLALSPPDQAGLGRGTPSLGRKEGGRDLPSHKTDRHNLAPKLIDITSHKTHMPCCPETRNAREQNVEYNSSTPYDIIDSISLLQDLRSHIIGTPKISLNFSPAFPIYPI